MSIQYTVRSCDHGDNDLVDHERDTEDISDYIDQLDMELGPRGFRPQNRTVLVRVCKRLSSLNETRFLNASDANGGNSTNVTETNRLLRCRLKTVTVKTQEKHNSDDVIPLDILEGLDSDKELVSHNATTRQRRQLEETSGEISSETSEDDVAETVIWEQVIESRDDITEGVNQKVSGNNGFAEEFDDYTGIVLNRDAQSDINPSSGLLLNSSNPNYVQSEPERLRLFELEIEKNNASDGNYTAGIQMSVEYDDYSEEVMIFFLTLLILEDSLLQERTWPHNHNPKCLILQENSTLDSFGSADIDMRSGEVRYRHYYIAAEEITWDYGIRKPHQLIRPRFREK